MCARLIRILNEMYRNKSAIVPKNTPNLFADDEVFAREFTEQRWPIDNSQSNRVESSDKGAEPTPLVDFRPAELMEALVSAEQFMRLSVKSLEILRAVEPDTRFLNPPLLPAMDWVRHALHTARRIQQTFVENEHLRSNIMRQGLSLPPALAKFVELISLVLSTYHLWERRCDDHWIWPNAATANYDQDWHDSCPYVDIVRELEEIQALLDKQNASRDRLRNANFTTACKLVDEAFVFSSKVLAIRLDLGYAKGAHPLPHYGKKDGRKSEKRADLETFLSHLRKILAFMKKTYGLNRLAYILKIEYGLQKGYHAHLLLLLNGHRHQQDISIAQQLGEEWSNDITQGTGAYWNCNAHKNHYQDNAMGMIHRKDDIKRGFLKSKVLTYLVKHDIPLELIGERPFRKFRPSHRKLK